MLYRAVAAAYRLRAEPRLLLLGELVPRGCTAVDAGAWWGPWTYWLSRRAASVWSFEPNPNMAAFLRRVAAPNVHVEAVGLSDRSGRATLFVPSGIGPDALATLTAARRTSDAAGVEVALAALDEYDLERVGFVKIDVEGHELEVLRGAERTLERWRPTLLVEIEQRLHDEPIEGIFDWLRARGYEGWVRRRGSWAPLTTFDVERDQLQRRRVKRPTYVNNFVFAARDRQPGRMEPGEARRRLRSVR
ncbi:MAG: FkbM family methyltransferase [Acidimicrobiales bacterium]